MGKRSNERKLHVFVVAIIVSASISSVRGRKRGNDETQGRTAEGSLELSSSGIEGGAGEIAGARSDALDLTRMAGSSPIEPGSFDSRAAKKSEAPEPRKRRSTSLLHNGTGVSDIRGFVDTHNAKRSNVDPPAADMKFMTWSSELAALAQTYAEKCFYSRDEDRLNWLRVGENLYSVSRPYYPQIAADAVTSWYAEGAHFNYESNRCASWPRTCDHYTQMVWATSYELGCGIATCSFLDMDTSGHKYTPGTIVVCNYRNRGNFPGWKPYVAGDPCSKCEAGLQCFNNVCRNPDLLVYGGGGDRFASSSADRGLGPRLFTTLSALLVSWVPLT